MAGLDPQLGEPATDRRRLPGPEAKAAAAGTPVRAAAEAVATSGVAPGAITMPVAAEGPDRVSGRRAPQARP